MISKIGAFALARGRVRSVPVAASLAAAALALASSPSLAQGFTETPTTDLSDSGLSPTVVAFTLGSNIVSGTSGHDLEGAIDRDYFTFTIGTDQALRAINILPATQTIGSSFIGLQSGTQVTLPTNTTTAAGLLGWTHYDSADILAGRNLLLDMSIPANGSTGFSGTLGTGSYSVWIQEISPGGPVPYSFDFVVGSVPEPGTWAMMLAGFGLLGLALRKRRAIARPALA